MSTVYQVVIFLQAGTQWTCWYRGRDPSPFHYPLLSALTPLGGNERNYGWCIKVNIKMHTDVTEEALKITQVREWKHSLIIVQEWHCAHERNLATMSIYFSNVFLLFMISNTFLLIFLNTVFDEISQYFACYHHKRWLLKRGILSCSFLIKRLIH